MEKTGETKSCTKDNKLNGFDFFYNRYGKFKPLLAFGDDISNKTDFEMWRSEARAELKNLLGFDKMLKVNVENATKPCGKNEKCYFKGTELVLKRFVMETQPELNMPFYVLEPLTDKKNSAIIAIHGHGSDGKEGLVGKSELPSIEKFNYTYALELAKRGYTVFVPDLLVAGERMIPIGTEGKKSKLQ
jgi:hypothetical protein